MTNRRPPDGADAKVPIIIDPTYDHNIQVPISGNLPDDIDTQVFMIGDPPYNIDLFYNKITYPDDVKHNRGNEHRIQLYIVIF